NTMKKNKSISKFEKMPNIAFRIMSLIFKVRNLFKPFGENIDKFGIQKNSIVVDYGCGPGMHIRKASELVGNEGLVYAVDIHELAIKFVKKIIAKYNLDNVKTFQTDGNKLEISNNTADLIYALDMFHMVKDYKSFLAELNRIGKSNCILILEDGHQPRKKTIEKVKESGYWEIEKEYKKYILCNPKNN
ncbi:MAG: class I SAM-dependent methyltransferase, partial [Bacteroidota bacterium]|nr:class I SAM-dependent methyltransferase [Bacteroidota bacterium]